MPGSSGPNSVAMLTPDWPWSTPGWITYLRNAPDAARLAGPPGEIGLSIWVCNTASQRSANP